MQKLTRKQALIAAGLLATLLFFTRYSAFGFSVYCANASMAVFFLGGLYLRRHLAFAALVAFALGIDLVALAQGHVPAYLFTSAYLSEPLAYALLWYGGAQCATSGLSRLALIGASLPLATLAFALTNGSFYWMSGLFEATSLAGWVADFAQWAPLFVGITVAYVGAVVLLHAAWQRLGGALPHVARTA